MNNKTHKKRKLLLRRKTRNTRNTIKYNRIKGGVTKKINVKTILVTKPIINAIRSMRNSSNIKGFKKDPNPSGFKLSRLANAHNLSKPISVKSLTPGSKYYSIINGRHRFAKLVALGEDTISVNIINQ